MLCDGKSSVLVELHVAPVTTTFSTHPALLVHELLLQYFAHLSKQDLIVAALVCKLWAVLSEDTLWRGKEVSLGSLYNKLDEKLDFVYHGPPPNRPWDLIWSLKPSHSLNQVDAVKWKLAWTRSAQRITRIRLDSYIDAATAAALRHLLSTHGEVSLCPNLQHACIHMASSHSMLGDKCFPMLPLLLGPSTLDVTLEHQGNIKDVEQALRIIAAQAPLVRRFTLCQLSGHFRVTWDGLALDFGQLTHARCLVLHDISLEAFYTTRACSELRELRITGGDWPRRADQPRCQGMSLPLLQVLDLSSTPLICPALVDTKMSSLQKLTFTYVKRAAGVDGSLQSVLEGLSQHSRSLEEMEVHIKGEELGADLIDIVCTMRALKKLRLVGLVKSFGVTDDCIASVGRSLPGLQFLSIDVKTNWEGLAVTHHSLLSIITQCQGMETLELPLDLSECDYPSPHADLPIASSIRKLSACHLKLPRDPTWAMQFLASRCPHAEDFRIGDVGRTQTWLKFEDLETYAQLLTKAFHAFRGDAGSSAN